MGNSAPKPWDLLPPEMDGWMLAHNTIRADLAGLLILIPFNEDHFALGFVLMSWTSLLGMADSSSYRHCQGFGAPPGCARHRNAEAG
jgi:hypothetical protein